MRSAELGGFFVVFLTNRMYGGIRKEVVAMGKCIVIDPSLLSANRRWIKEEIDQLDAKWFHWDKMDGLFVPEKTDLDSSLLRSCRPITRAVYDVHLMVKNPDDYIKSYALAGADYITVHIEACHNVRKTLKLVRSLGKRAGLAFGPDTPVDGAEGLLDLLDMVLVMTVYPGRSGQCMIESCLEKVRQISGIVRQKAPDILVQVDGGIDLNNIGKVCAAGADIFVAGNAVFKSTSKSRDAILELHSAALRART